MASDPDNRPAGRFGELPPDALPVFVAGPSGLETYRIPPLLFDPDRPEPDWRMATVPLTPVDRLPAAVGVRDATTTGVRERRHGGRHACPGSSGSSRRHGPRRRRPEPRTRLGRRAVVALVAAALAAGALVGAGVTLLAHHDAERATRTSAISVDVVTLPGHGSGSVHGPGNTGGGVAY